MKITDVRVHMLQSPLAQPFAFSQGWVDRRSATLVEVSTDAGITGWGEAFAQGLEPPQVAAAAIEHALRPLVVGADPLEVEVLWHRMYHQTRDYGRKGAVVAAISAIDIALWDIAGKHYGQPVHRLLGGAFRRSVQPYATGFYRIRGQGEAARLAEEALAHFEAGFRLMKVKLGYGVDDDIAVIRAVARAVEGRGVTLMVDTNHAYGRAEALRLGHVLDEMDMRWYEEPVAPEDVDGYCELRAKLRTPIAGGENEHTLYGFRELLGRHAVDVAQPDIGSCGGITGARHIVALAQAHGIEVNPHVWGSAVAQAASLQLIAALPVTHHSVFAREPVLEYDRSSHPFRRDLVAEPIDLRDGRVQIPQGPGLGIELRADTLQRFRIA
ncbi:mandelate racemase/muconate lactonizing enzyme family protein [Burkholderiaceae bacterium FT117]|uniref:mandelate racemase/muconate lactonizing enzyme family protein n=1 Tax=Zeimonas sediminis TaxID=2944268 RepID=UPI002342ECAE|nr:mandelate racemase/muconate lactonizing enzyme family protein [Zeimonas sediminis]MCM5570931.1 mandelate racemase/muconate lactonizing enzyme family protein [Zeimonas sediminis]